jgi:acylphosphatase
MSELTCKYFKVTGKVQGVSFRAFTQRQARLLNLTGWVRNCPDGSVELVACGTEDSLASMEAWLHHGSDWARVDQVLVEEAEKENFDDFYIR